MDFLVDQGHVSEHALYLRKRLAFESTMQDNVVNIFRSIIPEFQKSLNDVSTSMIESSGNFITSLFKSDERRSLDILEKLNYTDISKMDVSVPEGFVGLLKDYAKAHLEWCYKLEKDVTESSDLLYSQLSIFITNKETRHGSHVTDTIVRDGRKLIDEYTRFRSAFFDPKNHYAKAKLANIAPQRKDFKDIYTDVNLAKSHQTSDRLRKMHERTRSVSNLVDVLLDNFKTTDDPKVSGPIGEFLADAIYIQAQKVNIYGMHFHDSVVLFETVDRLRQRILDLA